jgi:hypothetical protein
MVDFLFLFKDSERWRAHSQYNRLSALGSIKPNTPSGNKARILLWQWF